MEHRRTRLFVAAVAAGDPAPLSSDGDESLATHRVVWAAEQARVRGQVVRLAPDGTVTA
jgi:hypothetical protein